MLRMLLALLWLSPNSTSFHMEILPTESPARIFGVDGVFHRKAPPSWPTCARNTLPRKLRAAAIRSTSGCSGDTEAAGGAFPTQAQTTQLETSWQQQAPSWAPFWLWGTGAWRFPDSQRGTQEVIPAAVPAQHPPHLPKKPSLPTAKPRQHPPPGTQRRLQDTLSPSIPRAVAGDGAVPEGSVPSGDKRHRCAGLKRCLGGHKGPSVPVGGGCERRRTATGENTAPTPERPEPRFPSELIRGAAKEHPKSRGVGFGGSRNRQPCLELVVSLFFDHPPCSE
ncbi:uncharacterized protein LOC121339027 [Onychostruthus taczanowskii]|uniref:uncharacterized protein LOC121339027 n=1 Tax=Onychostruthus taczanowskii TaxID=356909 RepID=UPI001B801238|nr:uncharacterized protein LOC121339027 [Onychostruthus taczanowskii]